MEANKEVLIDEPASKKARRRFFTKLENELLLQEVNKDRELFTGRFKGTRVTKEKRDLGWDAIALVINQQCGQQRSSIECEKRLANMTRAAVTEVSTHFRESQKTGGGPPPKEPTELSYRIVDNLVSLPKVVGIGGRLDTLVIQPSKTSAALSSPAVSSAAPEPFLLSSDELELEKRVTAGSSRTDEVMQTSHKEEMKQRFKAYAERTADKPAKRTNTGGSHINEILALERGKLPSEEDKVQEAKLKALKIQRLEQEIQQHDSSHRMHMQIQEEQLKNLQLKNKLLKRAVDSENSFSNFRYDHDGMVVNLSEY